MRILHGKRDRTLGRNICFIIRLTLILDEVCNFDSMIHDDNDENESPKSRSFEIGSLS